MIKHEDYFPVPPSDKVNIRTTQPYDWYLKAMGETRVEAIKRLNSYCLVPYNFNVFDYLDDNIIRLINNQKLIYNEFNFGGGRYGKKTFEIANFIVKTIMTFIYTNKKVAIYCFRYLGSALGDLKDEINNALNRYQLNESHSKQSFNQGEYIYTNTYNSPKWRFIGDSFIQLRGMYKATDRTIALKGLPSAQDYDLAITFQEEANEFSNRETNQIQLALRGASQYIYFFASNPDILETDYIKYINDNLPFNKNELETKGYQFKKIIDKDTGRGKVFTITNWRINPFLGWGEIQAMKELEKRDPHQYISWGLGMPGSLQTAVFAPYLFDKEKTFIGNELIAGMDVGFGESEQGHPTAVTVCEMDLQHKRIHPIAEYYHSNATQAHKDTIQIVDEILLFFYQLSQNPKYHRMLANGLNVKVDFGGGGKPTIDILNNRAKLKSNSWGGRLSDWLKFSPVKKKVWLIRDRIQVTIALLNTGKLTISKADTPFLFNEMKNIKYKKNTKMKTINTEPVMEDIHDDSWDSLCYSWMDFSEILINEWQNDLLYHREYQQLFKEEINSHNIQFIPETERRW